MGTGVGVSVRVPVGIAVSSGVGVSVVARGSVGDGVFGAAGASAGVDTLDDICDWVVRGIPVGTVVDCGVPVGVPVGVGAVAGVRPLVGVLIDVVRSFRAFERAVVAGTADVFPSISVPEVTGELTVRTVTSPTVRSTSSPASEAHPEPTSSPPTPTAPRRTSCRFIFRSR